MKSLGNSKPPLNHPIHHKLTFFIFAGRMCHAKCSPRTVCLSLKIPWIPSSSSSSSSSSDRDSKGYPQKTNPSIRGRMSSVDTMNGSCRCQSLSQPVCLGSCFIHCPQATGSKADRECFGKSLCKCQSSAGGETKAVCT